MAEVSERVDSFLGSENDNGVNSSPQGDNQQVGLVALAKEDSGREDLMASAREGNQPEHLIGPTEDGSGQVDSLAPTKDDNARVDSLPPTKDDNVRVDSLAPTKEDPDVGELARDIEKVDVAADTVTTPTRLTLIYSKDTPAAFTNFFPKSAKKISLPNRCHIGRHDDAHVYLNGDNMSREFGQIGPMDGDITKFILVNKSKKYFIQVVYSKGKKTMSKTLKFDQSMHIQTNYLIKFHTLEFKVEIIPGDVSAEYYELDVVQEVPRKHEETPSRSSPVIVNKGQINRLYMASHSTDTNSGPVHMVMSNYRTPPVMPYQYPHGDMIQRPMPQNSPDYRPGMPHGQLHAPHNFMTQQPHYYPLEHPYCKGQAYQHSQGQMNNGFPLGNNGYLGNNIYGLGNPGHHMARAYPGPPFPNHPGGNYVHPAHNLPVMQPYADGAFQGYQPYNMGHPGSHPLQAVGKGTSSLCPSPAQGDEYAQYFYHTHETDSLVGASGKVTGNDPGAGWIGPRVAQERVRAPVENSELPDPIARLMQKADP